MIPLVYYWRHLRTVSALYEAEKWQETIDFLTTVAAEFPDLKPEIYYIQMAAAVKLEKNELFFQLLNEILDTGGWYTEEILRETPAFKPLQGMPEFEKLVPISIKRAEQAQKQHQDLTEHPEKPSTPPALMLALHAQASLIKEEYKAWKTILNHGYVLAMPQTTNRYWSGPTTGYWPDYETATNQIKTYLDKINPNNKLNLKHTITGGLSMGGDLAIRHALTQTTPTKGFIAVSPGGPWRTRPENWQPLIDTAPNKDIQGIIIRGRQDQAIPRKYTQTLTKMLNKRGITCQFKEYPRLGHWYPPDLPDIITDFIKNIES